MNQKALLCMVWIFGTIGATGIVASCVTTYWQKGIFKSHVGLWQSCGIFGCTDVKIISDNADMLNAVKALMVIGIVFIGIINFVNVIGTCMGKSVVVPLVILEVVAIGCVAGSLALYTVELKKPTFEWGWSFMVGWAGLSAYVVGFLFLCITLCQS